MAPSFSIVIPVNNSKSLQDTIKAIEKQKNFMGLREILIVGQQIDLSLPNALYKFIRVDHDPNVTNNRNIGMNAAQGDWILFIDSDCIPKDNWLEQIRNCIKPGIRVICGAVDISSSMPYWGKCHHFLCFGNQAVGIANKQQLKSCATLNFFIHRDTLFTLNGFNNNLVEGGEDRDLCWRLDKAGIPIEYAPKTIVIHNHSRKYFLDAWKHTAQFGKNYVNFRKFNGDSNFYWKAISKIAKVYIVGEIFGLIRVLFRALFRLVQYPGYLKKLKFYPGVIILDVALSIGILWTLRTNDAKNWNHPS